MSELTIKHLGTPDERRSFAGHGYVDIFDFGGGSVVGRAVLEPGWKWSTDVRPIAGTESCQASHAGFVISGRMVIAMNDGRRVEVGPGDMVSIPPGHDAWVVGDESCIMVDFEGMSDYARRKEEGARYVETGEVAPGIH